MLRVLWLGLLLLPAAAFAQPSQKPIRIIVPFAPGASADGIARAISIELGKRSGKTVVVENMTGAGGSQGLITLSKAPPDGDTLGVGIRGRPRRDEEDESCGNDTKHGGARLSVPAS